MSDSGRERTCWETPAGTPGRRTSAAPQGQPIRPNLPTHHRFCYDQPEPPQGIRLSAVNPRCGSPCVPGDTMTRITTGLLMTILAVVAPREAFALITGRGGKQAGARSRLAPGAAAIFNHPGRIAWWEGPPFGGGQWHAECRGDAKALERRPGRFRQDGREGQADRRPRRHRPQLLARPERGAGEAGGGEDRLGLHGLAARQLGTPPQAAGRPEPDRARRHRPARRRSTSSPAASAGPT